MHLRFAVAVVALGLTGGAGHQGIVLDAQARRPVTVDDLMALSTINDVEIAPAGDRIAYTVSTPSLATNVHETRLFVIPTAGGSPVRLAEDARLFVPALPAPRLRWSPDGSRLAFLGLAGARPQVFAVAATGGASKPLTAAPEGVSAYEWSPDGKALAFLTRDVAPPPPVATPAGSLPARTRLWVQRGDDVATARALTPADRFVDSLSWSPDGREIA
jgi:dipeptidyl aminopeptidase/acylaminoacyl peptidase